MHALQAYIADIYGCTGSHILGSGQIWIVTGSITVGSSQIQILIGSGCNLIRIKAGTGGTSTTGGQ